MHGKRVVFHKTYTRLKPSRADFAENDPFSVHFAFCVHFSNERRGCVGYAERRPGALWCQRCPPLANRAHHARFWRFSRSFWPVVNLFQIWCRCYPAPQFSSGGPVWGRVNRSNRFHRLKVTGSNPLEFRQTPKTVFGSKSPGADSQRGAKGVPPQKLTGRGCGARCRRGARFGARIGAHRRPVPRLKPTLQLLCQAILARDAVSNPVEKHGIRTVPKTLVCGTIRGTRLRA